MKGIVKIALLAAFVIWALFVIFGNASANSEQNSEQPAFDHNRCQYPERETNPPDGCDNSDPACPETIKYGYDCQPMGSVTQAEEIPTSQNTVIEGK